MMHKACMSLLHKREFHLPGRTHRNFCMQSNLQHKAFSVLSTAQKCQVKFAIEQEITSFRFLCICTHNFAFLQTLTIVFTSLIKVDYFSGVSDDDNSCQSETEQCRFLCFILVYALFPSFNEQQLFGVFPLLLYVGVHCFS